MIPNSVIRDNKLSLKARALLIFMLQLPEDWTFTEKGLATATNEGLKSVRSALKELEQTKYLYRVQGRSKSGKGFGSMLYYLFEEPTEMLINGKEVVNQNDQKTEEVPNIPTPNVLNITKDHPDFGYFNGGWMLED